MIIKSFYMKENMVENIDRFSSKRTLIFSKENSKGKSTYLRLLFYALGYSIPQMKNIKFADIQTEILISEKNKEFCVTRENLTLKVFNITDHHNLHHLVLLVILQLKIQFCQ